MSQSAASIAVTWCDRCETYQPAESCRPMEPRSRYHICTACDSKAVDDLTDAYRDAGFDALTPLAQRYMDGDR